MLLRLRVITKRERDRREIGEELRRAIGVLAPAAVLEGGNVEEEPTGLLGVERRHLGGVQGLPGIEDCAHPRFEVLRLAWGRQRRKQSHERDTRDKGEERADDGVERRKQSGSERAERLHEDLLPRAKRKTGERVPSLSRFRDLLHLRYGRPHDAPQASWHLSCVSIFTAPPSPQAGAALR